MTGAPAALATGPQPVAARATRLKVVALVLVALGIWLDLVSKSWIQARLGMDPNSPQVSDKIELIPGFLRFEGTWNQGITFGAFAGHTEPILVCTALACLGLLAAIVLIRSPSKSLHLALALILGGAVGNLYDRWMWQMVRDFVVVYWKDPSIWHFYVFNVADSMIVVGVSLILWRELFGKRPAKAAANA